MTTLNVLDQNAQLCDAIALFMQRRLHHAAKLHSEVLDLCEVLDLWRLCRCDGTLLHTSFYCITCLPFYTQCSNLAWTNLVLIEKHTCSQCNSLHVHALHVEIVIVHRLPAAACRLLMRRLRPLAPAPYVVPFPVTSHPLQRAAVYWYFVCM